MKVAKFLLLVFILSLTPVKAEIFYSDDLNGFELEPSVIAQLEENLKKEDESGMATIYINAAVPADSDFDGDSDLLLSYSLQGIGGGNMSLMSLAYFARQSGNLTLKAEMENSSTGTGVGRIIVPTGFKNGYFECETLEFSDNDGAANPSIKGKTRLVFDSEQLREIPVNTK